MNCRECKVNWQGTGMLSCRCAEKCDEGDPDRVWHWYNLDKTVKSRWGDIQCLGHYARKLQIHGTGPGS